MGSNCDSTLESDNCFAIVSDRGVDRITLAEMVRKFKHHEQRLLKKVDFYEWKRQDNPNEALVMRRYHIQGRDDYAAYSKLAGQISKMANELSLLKPDDPFRARVTVQLLDKLYDWGIISSKSSLSQLRRVTVSCLARRRLPVILMKLRMAQGLKQAVQMIEQGHVRVGPECITNPAFHVTRQAEDFITWTDSSKIRVKIADYRGETG